jgi:hypothetical protein
MSTWAGDVSDAELEMPSDSRTAVSDMANVL